ncbi:ABC transporter substrate-binding protein [Nocardia takedensis]
MLLPLAAGCAPGLTVDSGSVRVAVAWSGAELAAFRTVLADLATPVDIEVVPLGDDIDTAVSSAGAAAPDIVMMPQIGRVGALAARGRLQALKPELWSPGYADYWRELLYHDGLPYGVPFKASAKSLVWYDREAVRRYGLGDPDAWTVQDWIRAAEGLSDAPVRLLALAGADGWVLTDSFENMLRAESPEDYDELADGIVPRRWDRPSVRAALGYLGALWSVPSARGVGHALTRQFPDAVREVFDHRTAVMVVMPDFAEPIVRRCLRHAKRPDDVVGTTWFPAIRAGGTRPRIVGGDVAVVTSRAASAAGEVVAALSTAAAPKPWIERYGGFLGPNHETVADYSPFLRPVIAELAEHRVFELSERVGAMGGRDGLWPVLTDFLRRVGDRAGAVEPAVEQAVRRLDEIERRHR